MPPVDHECALIGIVAELSNQLEKVKHELAQLKKAHIGPKSERSKMPRTPSAPVTAEAKLAKRRAQAADRAQTQSVRTEHKVPVEQRTCPSCGNDRLRDMATEVPTSAVRRSRLSITCVRSARKRRSSQARVTANATSVIGRLPSAAGARTAR